MKMEEVKSPKKPLIYYYIAVLLVIFLFNMLLSPMLQRGQVIEVDYGRFMNMVNEKDIGTVQMDDNQIIFTNTDNTMIFKTGYRAVFQQEADAAGRWQELDDVRHGEEQREGLCAVNAGHTFLGCRWRG